MKSLKKGDLFYYAISGEAFTVASVYGAKTRQLYDSVLDCIAACNAEKDEIYIINTEYGGMTELRYSIAA